MREDNLLNAQALLDVASKIFGETTDFDEAYALAEEHASALRESIYDPAHLNQRHTSPLHIAVKEIADPKKNELFLLFYDKNEPWVLLQADNDGVSALDFLCRQGNEWLIRFLLPDTYNFDIDGLPDGDIEDMDDDKITLYDILNLRFKHQDNDEENNEFGLQYTLTHKPQSHPLAECIRSNNTHVFKLLAAANFPLNAEDTSVEVETTDDVKELERCTKQIDSRINALKIYPKSNLFCDLLNYPEEAEALLLLAKCKLFTSLSRKTLEENELEHLCRLMGHCIPHFLEQGEEGKLFIFQFLAFIETKTQGDSTLLYETILKKALLMYHGTVDIKSLIFIIDAFVACRKFDWSEAWTEDKADEIRDAYVDDITSENDFNPVHFGRSLTPDSDDSDDCEEQIVYPLVEELIIEKRRNIGNMKEDCSGLWSDGLLKLTLDKPPIVKKILLARGAVFPEEMLTSETFPCPILCRLTVCLGDLNLAYFISLVETLSDTALENLCERMSDSRLEKYVNELFDLGQLFTRNEEYISLKTLATEDSDYLLNTRVTSRLQHSVLPRLFKFIYENEAPRKFFHVNHELGIQSIDASEKNLAFYHFFSIFLTYAPGYFFGSLIKKEAPQILLQLNNFMKASPSENVPQRMVENMLAKPKHKLQLLHAVAIRISTDGGLRDHTTQLIELILGKPVSKAWHAIEHEHGESFAKLTDLAEEANEVYDILYKALKDPKEFDQKKPVGGNIIFWSTEQDSDHQDFSEKKDTDEKNFGL